MEKSMECPQKTIKGTTLGSSHTTSKKNKLLFQRDICTSTIHCSIIYNRQDMETAWPLTDEWIKKKWCIYTREYCSAMKKENFAICTNMNRPLSEVLYGLTHVKF